MLELMLPFYFLTFAKVSVSVSKTFGLKKVSVSVSKKSLGIGLENIWSRKKSRYRSQKYLVSKESLGLENFGLEKSLFIGLDEIFWSHHSVVNCEQFPLMMIATIPFLRLQKAEAGQELSECPD